MKQPLEAFPPFSYFPSLEITKKMTNYYGYDSSETEDEDIVKEDAFSPTSHEMVTLGKRFVTAGAHFI